MGIFNKKKEDPRLEKKLKADANVTEPEPEPKEAAKGEKGKPKEKKLTPEELSEKTAIVLQLKMYTDSEKLLIENIQNAESVSIREFVIWKALTRINQAVQASQTAAKFIDIFVK